MPCFCLNRYRELWNKNHGILLLILQYKCHVKTLNFVYIRIMNIMTPTYSGVPNSQTRLTINTVEKKSQVFYFLLQYI